jgi:hypothetical protein
MYCAKELLCSGYVPCVAQEEQGFGPSTLSTYPFPIYLKYWGLFTSNLGPGWTGSYRPEEGFQVRKKNRREAKGNQQGEVKSKGIAPCYVVNLYMYIIIV